MTNGHREDLVDAPLRDEISLVAQLVIAAAHSDCHLSEADIDHILGIPDAGGPPVKAAAG